MQTKNPSAIEEFLNIGVQDPQVINIGVQDPQVIRTSNVIIEDDTRNLNKKILLSKSITRITKPCDNKQITTRTMMRQVSQTIFKPGKLCSNMPYNHIIKRYNPDKGYTCYSVQRTTKEINPHTKQKNYEIEVVTANGKELPQHEVSHIIVRDNETGKDVAILTSAKNPCKGNIFIGKENFKNQVDTQGKLKTQHMRNYDKPRYSADCKNMIKNEEATMYVKKYENEINNAVKKSDTYKKTPIYRVDKDAPILYHENGLPIYNKDGNEIDYDN